MRKNGTITRLNDSTSESNEQSPKFYKIKDEEQVKTYDNPVSAQSSGDSVYCELPATSPYSGVINEINQEVYEEIPIQILENGRVQYINTEL